VIAAVSSFGEDPEMADQIDTLKALRSQGIAMLMAHRTRRLS
jgi:hypothetical protein